MADFRISRLRYTWRGDWANDVKYNRDDVIRYGGSVYVCIRQHVSDTFAGDQLFKINQSDTNSSPAWLKMAEGFSYRGAWQASTLYDPGDIVLYGGVLYLNLTAYTSNSVFDDGIDNWTIYGSGINFRGDWSSTTRYGTGDVVRYGGNVYRCVLGHLSSDITDGIEVGNNDELQDSTLETWELYYEGIEFKGQFSVGTRYKLNDLVLYNGTVFRCTQGHTADLDIQDEFFSIEFEGKEFEGVWNGLAFYNIGSIVRYGGYLYEATAANSNNAPIDSIYQRESDRIYWRLLSKGIRYRGDWDVNTLYRTGDVVRRGGELFSAILDTVSDGSTLDYLDTSNWEKLNSGTNWRNFWTDETEYQVGDVVIYLGSAYRCNTSHTSSDENFPGDNGSGFFYWDTILESASEAGLINRGDLLTYDLQRENVGDTSTFGPTGIRVGSAGQLLTINSEDRVIYDDYGQINRVFYVNLDGVDDTVDPQRGISPFKAWRTVRFACEQANDGFSGRTTIQVDVGTYREVLPIVIPPRTVVQGSELRSTTISPNLADETLTNDYVTFNQGISRLATLMPSLIQGLPVIKTESNTTDAVSAETVGSLDAVDEIQTKLAQVIQYINFYVGSFGTDVTVTGSNTARTASGYTAAANLLSLNRDFLANEHVAFLTENNEGLVFDEDKAKYFVRRIVDALVYDIVYTGNYETVKAAQFYKNTVLGSATEDMFYVRDVTGVRNCTLQGLEGTLSPPNVFDLYRRPTGGAFVSLDAGWGPEDTSTWINNRSPYIQGVTTIGTGCTGQRIDGSIHDGGNKSIVSNDFTQVLSDGIGAFVSNNGRAELVSVFSYYAQVGYLAEDGGIIRATNGNCSYGAFGAIAEGVDPTETPTSATVNNRNQEAIVASAFSGDFTDEIQILEWRNAGERYSQATAEIVGSGANAQTKFEDFRDNAVFRSRLLDANPSQFITAVGGGGFIIQSNNAQVSVTPSTDLTGITIASNDENDPVDYIGKRIIISSGTGTGQYAEITAYNTNTKIVTVKRESDGQPGWDHVVSGTDLARFDTSTTYRIEPMVTYDEPRYSATEYDLPTARDWVNSVYGETVATYTGLGSTAGTGDVVTDDGLTPVTASFNVTKTGRTYSVAINNAGAGYAVGDTITIIGTALGGSTPDNDLVIEVTETTDDSTNSIVDFEITGTGSSGVFVVTANSSSAGAYSPDGENWSNFSLPSTGDWKSVAAGNNLFVALKSNSNEAAFSTNGISWTAATLPLNRNWSSVTYGDGLFVAVAEDQNGGAFSTDGENWTATTLPTVGDSATNQWIDITYGKNKFVAVANSNNIVAVGEYSSISETITWTGYIMDVIADSTQVDWVSIAYGRNRFVAISSTGDISYSFNGIAWKPASMPSQDGSTAHFWRQITYAQGLFFAVGDTGARDLFGDVVGTTETNYAATSLDGIIWTERELASSYNWKTVAFGNPYIAQEDSTVGTNSTLWIACASNTTKMNRIRAGARALGRVTVSSGLIGEIKIWDPGSGYEEPPNCLIFDPNSTAPAITENRIGDGVLSDPSWINRGTGFRTASTTVTIFGDGFADVIPVGKFVTIDGLQRYPGPGAQVIFRGNDTIYTIQTLTELGRLNGIDGGLSANVRVAPDLRAQDKLEHGTVATLRERYSQCRITGHDFLDIGTGNFEQTNYPDLYTDYTFVAAPENEVREDGGGRVFYTSTDQSGNFRTGELFAVEQSTGIVTISSDFFNLDGLSELRLGGIRVGGSGVVIREFSTDPLFTEDSNNIVPTQKAIAAYLDNRLSVGGAEIATASFVAGTVSVGPNQITNTAGLPVVFPGLVRFEGENSQITGQIIAQIYAKYR